MSSQQIPMPGTKDKSANLLSMCIRAGRAVKGFDAVCDEIESKRACCVIFACDAAERTVRNIVRICGENNVPVYASELSRAEMGRFFRSDTAAVAAVCDKGFAKAFGRIFAAPSDAAF